MSTIAETKSVVLVSGANGGIGSAVAREMMAAGYCVSLGDMDVNALTETYGPQSDDRIHAEYDALKRESSQRWVDDTIAKFGRIDALINCSGSAERVTLFDDNEEALDRLWEINAKGPLRLTRQCLPYLEKSGRGRVINLVSLAGKRVKNTAVGYAMTKFALLGVTHSIRTVTWDKGIRATAICPGWVRTPMSTHCQTLEREDMTQPENVAELVRTVIELPNNAAIGELLINCEFEDVF
ncbi:MAG: SDR family NAD(P)-dependent oxidoreductase [Rhodospirillales bacterium]|jgi:NADP-dependent 3-hydroxy acid dehydrogenase YdfG|nr:SDR family NAD(P)-dependent oxidoreductase [Rhodospirillales bacterium]